MTVTIEHWATHAEYDLSVAEILYQQEVYRYCIFFCHLALEKLLKAVVIEYTGLAEPPHTHRLNVLARRARVNLPYNYHKFMQDLTKHSISARYPELDELDSYNGNDAERILNLTREVYEWLSSRMAL